uniref:Filamin-C n=1 Tax=Cacopsylla melanoneura TaxID=428564 RepID=A0A8D8PWX3_9HEMI
MTSDELRISQIGMKARSPEGHAAKGMQIKGHEDIWVDIQNHTFKNWVNEHLKVVGLHVQDLSKDLSDGTKLCALVEILQKRKLKYWIKKPTNQHQFLENVTCALNAVNEDGIKLVNIGNVDIVNGNLKLILGLIWSLIVHYQIGRSKFPPKKLMLGWLKAALPECRVNNFTTDWNSGIALSALLDYCEPGLFPHWKYLDPNDRVDNCRSAMELARTHFNIPMVLEPEYLASPHLDELSGMTYLSYFMREHSAGFRATLAWVNSQLKDHTVSNFTTDWNDGKALCSLVKSLGSSAKYQPSSDPSVWEANLERGMAAGRRLGVEPILRAKDMADTHVEHLGVMQYAASFQWVKPRINPGLSVSVNYDAHTTRIYQPTNFKIDFHSSEIDSKDITAEIRGPEATKLECRLTLNQEGGTGTFTPVQIGMHRVSVMCEGEEVKGSPFYVRAMPQLSAITHTGLDPCAVGSIVEVLVNSHGAKAGLVEVEAMSPTGRTLPCPVNERDGTYSATFQPDEAGEWSISVLHAGQLIQGGPFTCFVFDPHGVQLRGLDKPAYPESIFNFTIDARATGGLGNIVIDIVHGKKSLPHTIESLGGALYKVSLHTYQPGKYRIYVYFNGNTVKGSPFPLRVGTRDQIQKEREKHHSRKHVGSDKHDSSSYDKYDRYFDSKFSSSDNKSSANLLSSGKFDRPSGFEGHNSFESKFDRPSSGFDGHSFENKFDRSSSGFDGHNSFESKHSSSYESKIDKHHTTSSLLNGFHHESSPSPTRFSPQHFTSSPSLNYSTSHNLKVPVNGYSYRSANDGSPLNSPPMVRNSPLSPLHSPISHSSFTFNTHNHVIDTSNNVRVSTKSSSTTTTGGGASGGSKNSWDFLGNKSNSLFDTGSLIAGDALQLMPVHRNSTLSLNSEAPLSQINVTVTSPSKTNVPVRLSRSLDGTKIHFSPNEIGEHYIDVKIYDTRITGSPFRSHAYNAQAIKVAPIPDGVVGQPVEFEIDGSEAGSGNLEILVNGGHVTSFVRNLGNQRFLASFVPHEARVHLIDMKFNGESCPGSPWSVSAAVWWYRSIARSH